MTFYVCITRCSDPFMWYSRQVGRVFECTREDDEYYWTRDTHGYLNGIKPQDAVKVVNDVHESA